MLRQFMTPDGFLMLLALFAVLLLAPFVVQLVVAKPSYGWRAAFIVLGAGAFVSLPSTSVGPIAVNARDLVVYLVLAAGLWRCHERSRWPTALLLVLAIFVLSVLRSFATFGIGGADLAFRAELTFIGAAIFGVSLAPSDLEPLLRDVRRLAYVFVVALLTRWAGLTDGIDSYDEAFFESRAVPAIYAATMAMALIYSLWSWLERRPEGRPALATVVLATCVVLTRHRSVWVAAFIGLVVLLLLFRSDRHRRDRAAAVTVSAGVLVMLIGPGLFGDLFSTLEQSASDTRTWEWRVDGWRTIWTQHVARGPISMMVGTEYGHPWIDTTQATGHSVSPHNFYVRVAVRLGLVAATIIVWMYVRVFSAAIRSTSSAGALVAALIAVQLAYFLLYDPDLAMALVAGALVSWSGSSSRLSTATSAETNARSSDSQEQRPGATTVSDERSSRARDATDTE
jgi:hypothetical protein